MRPAALGSLASLQAPIDAASCAPVVGAVPAPTNRSRACTTTTGAPLCFRVRLYAQNALHRCSPRPLLHPPARRRQNAAHRPRAPQLIPLPARLRCASSPAAPPFSTGSRRQGSCLCLAEPNLEWYDRIGAITASIPRRPPVIGTILTEIRAAKAVETSALSGSALSCLRTSSPPWLIGGAYSILQASHVPGRRCSWWSLRTTCETERTAGRTDCHRQRTAEMTS